MVDASPLIDHIPTRIDRFTFEFSRIFEKKKGKRIRWNQRFSILDSAFDAERVRSWLQRGRLNRYLRTLKDAFPSEWKMDRGWKTLYFYFFLFISFFNPYNRLVSSKFAKREDFYYGYGNFLSSAEINR